MQKLFDFLENRLMAPMSKLSQFHFVRAVGAAGMGSIPFTIVGSAFLIISIVPTVLPFMLVYGQFLLIKLLIYI